MVNYTSLEGTQNPSRQTEQPDLGFNLALIRTDVYTSCLHEVPSVVYASQYPHAVYHVMNVPVWWLQ